MLNKENTEVELIFYKEKDEIDENILISEEDDVTANMDSFSSDKNSFDKNEELGEEFSMSQKSNKNEKHDIDCEINTDKQKDRSHVIRNKYLDLDADYSGESGEEDDLEEDEISSFIDNTCDNNFNIGIYTKDMDKSNNKMLEDLKSKFLKKDKIIRPSIENTALYETIADSTEDFPEIQDHNFEEDDLIFNTEDVFCDKLSQIDDVEVNTIEKKKISKEDSIFNDRVSAIDRLTKKDNAKNVVFFEKWSKD